MVFDDHPHLFVDLSRSPIVFTVRGISHFSPFFRRLGIPFSRITTREEFDWASAQASMLHMEDVAIRINERARSGHAPSEYKVLAAFLSGGDVSGESKRLAHKNSTNLHSV